MMSKTDELERRAALREYNVLRTEVRTLTARLESNLLTPTLRAAIRAEIPSIARQVEALRQEALKAG